MSSRGLKDKTVKGLSWSAIDNVANHSVSFIVGVILARLLSPDEFGTIGIAMIFVTLFNTIVNSGFSSALIRKQDVTQTDYNTTFVFNFVVSCVLYGVCFFVAPLIARFFNQEILVSVVRWISLVIIINAFAIIQQTRIVKSIDFKTLAKISLIASSFSGCIGIAMAYKGFGVYSLVGQQLSRQFISTVLLWVYNKWWPRIEFSIKSFKELFSYGSKLLLSGIIDTICNEMTTVFVGKIYSTATLGQYSRARQFSGFFTSNISSITQRVTYPVLSEMQGDEGYLIMNYRRIIKSLMLVVGLGSAFIFAGAKSIILILVGSKWTEAIILLQLVVFNDITIPLKNINLNLLQVYGRSDYILRLSIIKRIIEFGAIMLGFFGLKYMIIGFAVAGVIGFLLNAYCTMKVSGFTVKDQVKDLLPSLSVSFLVGFVMYLISLAITNIYISLIVQVIVGGGVFYLIARLRKMQEFYFLKGLAVEYILKLRKRK